MIIILILGNSGKLPVIRCYDFSVCLKTGSNSEDINRFESHTGKEYINSPKSFIMKVQ